MYKGDNAVATPVDRLISPFRFALVMSCRKMAWEKHLELACLKRVSSFQVNIYIIYKAMQAEFKQSLEGLENTVLSYVNFDPVREQSGFV